MPDYSPEERLATWKLLLPWDFHARVLTLGVGPFVVQSLRRSYKRVDVAQPEFKHENAVHAPEPYRICVCHESCLPELSAYQLFFSDDLLLVVMGSKPLRYVSVYGSTRIPVRLAMAGLPARQPRIFLDLTSRFSRRAGLRMHVPGSWLVRVKVTLAAILSEFGITWPFSRFRVTFFSQRKYTPDLVKRTETVFQDNVSIVTLYAGSIDVKRKMTAAMTMRSGRQIVLKLPDTIEGEQAIRCETAVLQSLDESVLKDSIPRILMVEEEGGYRCQWQSGLPPECVWMQSDELTVVHLAFLKQMARMGTVRIPLGEVPLFRSIQERVKRLEEHETVSQNDQSSTAGDEESYSELLRVVHYLCEQESSQVECGLSHGDFTPWNMRVSSGQEQPRIFVYDWEDSQERIPCGFDAFQFIYRQRRLVGPWRGIDDVMSEYHSKTEQSLQRDIAAYLFLAEEYLRRIEGRI